MGSHPQPWESRVLRLLAEQQAIPLDQLARFLDCDEPQAARLLSHLTTSGYADYGRILHGEPHWAWPTRRALRHTGVPGDAARPGLGAIERIRAVNAVRLLVTQRAPEVRWVCGRTVLDQLGRRGHRPNAVVEVDGERHAIVVRLRATNFDLFSARIQTLCGRYDAVVVFCAPVPRRQLKRYDARNHLPKLVIRPIPE